MHSHGAVNAAYGSFNINFVNTGEAAAVFHVRSGHSVDVPRSYTVEPKKQLTGAWNVNAIGATEYDLSVYGPNGFLRRFKGGVSGQRRANIDARVIYDDARDGDDDVRSAITLKVTNQAAQTATVRVFEKYTGKNIEKELEPGKSMSKRWSLKRVFGWYDLEIMVDQDPGFAYHFAGHVETGLDSFSDPAMGGIV